MPEIAEGVNGTPEPIRPEGDCGPRRFIVVITEVGERIVHNQQWATWLREDGTKFGGYHSTAVREVVEREIFRGEFASRPVVSALAKLMEGEQP